MKMKMKTENLLLSRHCRSLSFLPLFLFISLGAPCVLGAFADPRGIQLDPGTEYAGESDPDNSMYFHFKTAPTADASPFETLIIRLVRYTEFSKGSEKVELCVSPFDKGGECQGAHDNFEVWLDYSLLTPNTTYYIRLNATSDFSFTLESCISNCQDTCPSDCNGRGGCYNGVCTCDSTRSSKWNGRDCSYESRLVAGIPVRIFIVIIIFVATFVKFLSHYQHNTLNTCFNYLFISHSLDCFPQYGFLCVRLGTPQEKREEKSN